MHALGHCIKMKDEMPSAYWQISEGFGLRSLVFAAIYDSLHDKVSKNSSCD